MDDRIEEALEQATDPETLIRQIKEVVEGESDSK